MALQDALGATWDSMEDLVAAVGQGYGKANGKPAGEYKGGKSAGVAKDNPPESQARAREAFQRGSTGPGGSFDGSAAESELFRLGNRYYDAQTNLRNNQRWAEGYRDPYYETGPGAATAPKDYRTNPRYNSFLGQVQQQQQVIADLERQRDEALEGFVTPGRIDNKLGPVDVGDVEPTVDIPPGATHDRIIQDLLAGRINEGTARAALQQLGVPAARVDAEVGDVMAQKAGASSQNKADTPRKPRTGTGGRDVSGAGGGRLDPELEKLIGPTDLFRRLSLESGISPSFRGLMENRLDSYEKPFHIQRFIGGNALDPTTEESTTFLRNMMQPGMLPGVPGVGQSLRDASAFLRGPETPGNIDGREALRKYLTNEGKVGSDFFQPITNMVLGQGSGSNIFTGGNDAGRRGIQSALTSMFANHPTRFQNPEDFIDFLQQSRLLR